MPDNELSDLLDQVDRENHQAPAERVEEKQKEEVETPKLESTEKVEETEESGEQDASQNQEQTTESESTAPLKTETENNAEQPTVDWKQFLPQAPAPSNVQFPEPDEDGNVDPREYEDYIVGKAEDRLQQKIYAQAYENAALDEVEKILPEIKTNPAVRKLIENQRIAQVVSGDTGDVVEIAKQIKLMMSTSKAEGAQNAKSSITIQKNAALETGAGQTKTDTSKRDALEKRLKKGDDSAFAELFETWEKTGKL